MLPVDDDDAGEVARVDAHVGRHDDLAIGTNGTCTGEHGIGQGRAAYLVCGHGGAPEAVRPVERAIEPGGILDPAKPGRRP